MINNKIEINEDSELNKLNVQNYSIRKEEKSKSIYSFKNLIKNKIFLIIIAFFIIGIITHIIISNFSKKDEEESLSLYDLKGIQIFKETGFLSFNKLDDIMFGNKTDYSNFNNIHIAMSFDNNYYLLSSTTIASLLKNSDKTTYIHLHIITVENFLYSTMKKLNSLKYKINKIANLFFITGQKLK